MKKVIEYIVSYGIDPSKLTNEISKQIQNGYEPWGTPIYVPSETTRDHKGGSWRCEAYYQAMVKYEPDSKLLEIKVLDIIEEIKERVRHPSLHQDSGTLLNLLKWIQDKTGLI